MQQISNTLGSFLSGATVTRVDVDGRAYKVISQVKRDDRLSPESFQNYYLTASNGQSVPLSSVISMKLETQPTSLPRFSHQIRLKSVLYQCRVYQVVMPLLGFNNRQMIICHKDTLMISN